MNWNLFLDILLDAFRSSILITGLVVVMMMLIESMNIDSKGDFFNGLRKSRIGQVVFSAGLGLLPGCMGGFASVSLYTHGIFSFGALVAMMIASSGDESFVMLAMFPDKAIWIFLLLFAIAIVVGILVDVVFKPKTFHSHCEGKFEIHQGEQHKSGRHFGWKRILMFVGVVIFIVALLSGLLEHEHGEAGAEIDASSHGLVNLLSEEWMYWLFGILSLIVLGVLLLGDDHFVEEHLWHHIVVKHLPSVFYWTFGVLLVLGVGLEFFNLSSWISENTVLMILLATLVGIIPESGPHLIFVTLFASGVVPFPVLLASCISQDGHASLPLLAESRKSFLLAKAINCAVALAAGFICLAIS